MVEFRAKRAQSILAKTSHAVAKSAPLNGPEKRRGLRVNSRVPIAVEWNASEGVQRGEAQTRVVGPYGCLVVLPQNLEVRQQVRLTNLVSKRCNAAVVVWCGNQRAEGWELGIELINPEMGFWGLEL